MFLYFIYPPVIPYGAYVKEKLITKLSLDSDAKTTEIGKLIVLVRIREKCIPIFKGNVASVEYSRKFTA